MTDLAAQLSHVARAAFAAQGLDPAFGLVRRSDRPDLAPFQCNGALAAAKAAGKPPRVIAELIAAALAAAPGVKSTEIAGPGFVNIALTDAALGARADAIAQDPRFGAALAATPRRVVVDYGGPNVAKGMHVGHLRASIIGESVKRLFRFRGDAVWGDAHFGDWGFQMGLLLTVIEERFGAVDSAAARDAITLDMLEEIYPAAAARAKTDAQFRDRARKATARLQGGDATYRAAWQLMRDVTMTTLKRDFSALSVDFDLWKGESDSDPLIPDMVADLETKGLLEYDQGARIVRVAGHNETPDLIIYVVDQRQADHFEIVFRAALLAGYAKPDMLEHIGFGTMNGTDGRPFKTREGGVLKLHDLISQAEDKARARMRETGVGKDFSAAEFEDVAHKVAVAAIKFADLGNARTTSYVFDLDRFMSFEGKTGPYLLYALVRVNSVLRKAAEQGAQAGPIVIAAPAERALALALDDFDAALTSAYDKRMPHFLAEHVYALSQAWSAFYDQCPILSADGVTRAARLSLARAVQGQLALGLDLLGIDAPERM